jgi:hypothetical protein
MQSSEKPQIGFDRFIQIDWAEAAFRTRAGLSDVQHMIDLVDASTPGAAGRKKTRTVLNRLWLEPRADLVDFADRAVDIYRDAPDTSIAALTWGMAISTYPFFASVAQIVGRLTALQGDCASAEVHRRMAEVYGEREGTHRMTNMVLQSQASWGAIDRIGSGKRLERKIKIEVTESAATCWLVEACLRYARRPLSIASLETNPVIYPFYLAGSLSYILSTVSALDVRTDGAGNQVVSLRG